MYSVVCSVFVCRQVQVRVSWICKILECFVLELCLVLLTSVRYSLSVATLLSNSPLLLVAARVINTIMVNRFTRMLSI